MQEDGKPSLAYITKLGERPWDSNGAADHECCPASPTEDRPGFPSPPNTPEPNDPFKDALLAWAQNIERALSEVIQWIQRQQLAQGAGNKFDADLVDGLEASAFALASHTHTKSEITDLEPISATPASATIVLSSGSTTIADGWIAQSGVTQHEAALTLTAAQITSLTFADARIAVSNVTQHELQIDAIASSFQVGSGGPRFKAVSGNLQARNAADSAFVTFTALSLSANNITGNDASGTFSVFAASPASQGAAVVDADVAHDVNATFSDTEVEAALDALGVKINTLLARERTFGFMAT